MSGRLRRLASIGTSVGHVLVRRHPIVGHVLFIGNILIILLLLTNLVGLPYLVDGRIAEF